MRMTQGDPIMNYSHASPGRPPFPAWFQGFVLIELVRYFPSSIVPLSSTLTTISDSASVRPSCYIPLQTSATDLLKAASSQLVDVPFFFIAIYAFVNKLRWIRLPAVAYSAHTVAALIPILMEVWASTAVSVPTPRH